jgi:hypothetical protein
MEHLIEVHNLLHGIRGSGLLSVAKGGIRDDNLFGRIGEDKFIIKFNPADLIVWENTPVEVWLLDIQEGEWLDRMLALKYSLLPCDGHILSSSLLCF